MSHYKKRARGFTLIEVLIVVVLIGILAALVIPQFSNSAEVARDSAASSTLKTVRSQVELYIFKEHSIPTLADLEDRGYLAKVHQPDGFCIAIDPATGEVSMTVGDCP